MKRKCLLLFVLLCTTTVFAQLKVYTNGSDDRRGGEPSHTLWGLRTGASEPLP